MIIEKIALELGVQQKQVEAVLRLLEEGNTVPFIARYRKEMTGNLDEEMIRLIGEGHSYQVNLQKRKEDVCRLIEQQAKLTDELEASILSATKLSEVEDYYRPYAQKKKTRASAAIAKGLEPLAKAWVENSPYKLEDFMSEYSEEEILQGAKDIIAEWISEDVKYRNYVSNLMMKQGKIVCKKKKNAEDEGVVFQMYYEYSEPIKMIATHRIMAIARGENVGVLSVKIECDVDDILDTVLRMYKKKANQEAFVYVEEAIRDGFKRLLVPAIERSVRSELESKAHLQSIDLFSTNLEQILLQSPIKNKRILGFDPAFRTGCKLAVLDEFGNVCKIQVIYPHPPQGKIEKAKEDLKKLIEDYKIDIIAIGNGTASRESESFVAEVISSYQLSCVYTIVSESGASVYSASKVAKEEFPSLQVEERSAISIGRRIQDPLSELIKIDPQSIGVGQYQHDLPQTELNNRLDFVVDKCVNRVGVNVNNASAILLQHVAGISKTLAKNIVAKRESEGPFKTRTSLKEVKMFGPKAYLQAAGFLRIMEGSQPLDATGLHPENYEIAMKIQKEYALQIGNVEQVQALNQKELIQKYNVDQYILQDILQAFQHELRDYREAYSAPVLRNDIVKLEDLKVGEELEGVVRNIVDFGAFIDIGLKSDGLVHISNMSARRIKHPLELLKIGDIVKCYVSSIDLSKQKVQLSLIRK